MDGDLTGRLEVTGSGDEFDRLAASLNAMLERIEGLMHGLKEVSDNIAHDLKTPLSRLRNRVESTLRGPTDSAAYRNALESTIDDADQLIRIFNALLIIAQAEAGSPDRAGDRVEVAEIVRDVAELYEPVAESAGGRLTARAESPLLVRGNRELIGQALANLIDNALKYGSRGEGAGMGANVAIVAEREGDRVVITVADDGPGIAAKDRERVLERFVRLEESRSAPGSGLGLALVAAVARLHGGEIALLDNLPRGLKVVLRLPALTEAA
jgi:signal transduction histidine kinase